MKAKEIIRLKKEEAKLQFVVEAKKKLIYTQLNKGLSNENNVPTAWYPGLLVKGVKRSNV